MASFLFHLLLCMCILLMDVPPLPDGAAAAAAAAAVVSDATGGEVLNGDSIESAHMSRTWRQNQFVIQQSHFPVLQTLSPLTF